MTTNEIPRELLGGGFYYHYKHDPEGPTNNYTYEVVGVGRHSEDENEFVVIYKPLYKSNYTPGKMFCVRPLEMFLEEVDGKGVPRFKRITDDQTIKTLLQIRDQN